MKNAWLVIGVNVHTIRREVIERRQTLEDARALKAKLAEERPRHWVALTVEYGNLEKGQIP